MDRFRQVWTLLDFRLSDSGGAGVVIMSLFCLSPTCSLGGVDPINDLSGAIAELVSSNSRFRRKALYNCPKCQNILVNATNCVCGSKSEFPRVLFRKAFAKAMALLTKINSLAKSRPIDSVRTHVTVHRWASYFLSHDLSHRCLCRPTF